MYLQKKLTVLFSLSLLALLAACGGEKKAADADDEGVYAIVETIDTAGLNDKFAKDKIGDIDEIIAVIVPKDDVEEGNYAYVVEKKESEQNKAIVIVTETSIPDDSTEGIKTRIELVKNGDYWQVEKVLGSYRCYPERGHQNWSPELCL